MGSVATQPVAEPAPTAAPEQLKPDPEPVPLAEPVDAEPLVAANGPMRDRRGVVDPEGTLFAPRWRARMRAPQARAYLDVELGYAWLACEDDSYLDGPKDAYRGVGGYALLPPVRFDALDWLPDAQGRRAMYDSRRQFYIALPENVPATVEPDDAEAFRALQRQAGHAV